VTTLHPGNAILHEVNPTGTVTLGTNGSACRVRFFLAHGGIVHDLESRVCSISSGIPATASHAVNDGVCPAHALRFGGFVPATDAGRSRFQQVSGVLDLQDQNAAR